MMQHGKTTFYISAFAVVYYLVVLYVCKYVCIIFVYTCTMYVCGKGLAICDPVNDKFDYV